MLEDIKRIYSYREMLKNLVKKDLRSRYQASVLGFLWTFVNPLLMLIVYSVIFSIVMKVKVPTYSYGLFLFVGLIPWTYFSNALQLGTTVVISNGNIVKKIYFPRIILPISVTLTNLVNMLFTFIIIFVALIYSKCPVSILYLYLPLIILIQTILVLAFSMILSCLTVFFRDLEHIMTIILMAWFYLSPVVFPSEYIPKDVYFLFRINPMMILTEGYRDVLMYHKMPETWGILYVCMLSGLLLFIGYHTFNKLQKKFAEEI